VPVGHGAGGGAGTKSTGPPHSSAIGAPALDLNLARSSQADAAVGDLFRVAHQLTQEITNRKG